MGSGFTLNSHGQITEDTNAFNNPSAAAEYALNIGSAVTPSFGVTLATSGGTWWVAAQAFTSTGDPPPTSVTLGGATVGQLGVKSTAIMATLDQPAGVGGVSVTITSSGSSDNFSTS